MEWFDRFIRRLFMSPFLWGALSSIAFYVSLVKGEEWIDPWLFRCLTGRWEAYLCVSLFFVAVSFLAMRAFSVVQQALLLGRPIFANTPETQQVHPSPESRLEQLHQSNAPQNSYLIRRLRGALQFAVRRGVSHSLADHLREMADDDRRHIDDSYSLTRFVIWALPAVGSLGTVLGIAAAVSQLSTTDAPALITGVTTDLAEAFDTFALSLALSILLVFFRFVCVQKEQALLAAVDERANQELLPLVHGQMDTPVSQFDQLNKLTESIVQAAEKLTQFSESSPRSSLERASVNWTQPAELDEQKVEKVIARAMNKAFQQHPNAALGSSVGNVDLSGWQSLQQALQQVAHFLSRQQAKQEGEGQAIQQLIEIVDEAPKSEHAPHFLSKARNRIDEEATIGVWK